MTRYPVTTGRRRLYTSARTPVGTCATRQTTSIAVPARSSWSGPRPAFCIWNTWLRVNAVVPAKALTPRMSR